MHDLVAQSWPVACSISQRLFRDPHPPEDLWKRAIQRTASALLEGEITPTNVEEFLLHSFENACRRRMRIQIRILPMSESTGSVCVEDAVVARLDLKKILTDLHPMDRELFILHFMTGRTWVEIAEMTGESKRSLQKRGARMMGQLRRKFGTRLNRK